MPPILDIWAFPPKFNVVLPPKTTVSTVVAPDTVVVPEFIVSAVPVCEADSVMLAM